jgi:LacI family transcriptional regulator
VVSAGLRQRILAAAQRLGYTPNLAARSLSARRTGLVGVMVDSLTDPLIAHAVAALERRLAAAGYGLLMVAVRDQPEHRLSALRQLLSRGAEALVLALPEHRPELAGELHARSVPWVSIADEQPGALLAVDVGRRRGAELAARYLLDLGHHRFGVIAATPATAAGVADALAAGNPVLGAPPAPDSEAAQATMRQLLSHDEPPTAVICGGDLYALAALRACLGQGRDVPGSVSIVGFGDADFARRAVPALTSVRLSAPGIGGQLADCLLARLEGAVPPPPFTAPIKLVVRESTGPAPR